jgi:hypothetical protein
MRGPEPFNTDCKEPSIKFHPCRPEIVYSSFSRMYTWRFRLCGESTARAGTRPVQIYTEPLRDFDYSMSGHHICGIDRNDLVVMFDMTQPGSNSKRTEPMGPLEAITESGATVKTMSNSPRAEPCQYTTYETQSSNSAVLAMNENGRPVVSILRQSVASSSLVEDVINDQGIMKSQNIMRIPEVLSHNRNLTVLPSVSGNRRVVIGVEPKTSYSFDQVDSAITKQLPVPLIFERRISSIRAWSTDLTVPKSTKQTLPLRRKRALCLETSESEDETSEAERMNRAENRKRLHIE